MAVSMSSPRRPSLREQQAELTRERLLEAAVALLERGEHDISLRSIAEEAGVSERTLYRHFEARDELVAALVPRLRERVGAPLPASMAELPGYARTLFERFERNRALVVGMTTSSGAHGDLERTRSQNLRDLRALVDAAFPDAPDAERAAATTALRVLLSGGGWAYLRVSCGLENEALIEHAGWTIAALVDRLTRAAGASASRT
jgi:AcrR family transcriptional regulator